MFKSKRKRRSDLWIDTLKTTLNSAKICSRKSASKKTRPCGVCRAEKRP